MKLKILEASVLLAVLVFVFGCEEGSGWGCLNALTQGEWTNCYNDITGSILVTYDFDVTGDVIETEREHFDKAYCVGSNDGYGNQTPTPNSMDTAIGSGPTRLERAAPSTIVRPEDSAGSGTTAGGFLGVPWLKLPFTPVAPAASSPVECQSSQPDVLMVDHGHGTLARIGTCPLAIKASIPVVSRPLQVVVTPDGTQALVTNYDNAVSFVNLATNTVAANLNTGNMNPSGLAISPDGKTAYVSSYNATSPAVMVIDIASRSITATIPLATQWPHSLALTPDGAQLWVAYPFSNQVDVIDTLSRKNFKSLAIGEPYGIDFSPTGTFAYVADAGISDGTSAVTANGTLDVVDTATLQIVKKYPVGMLPNDVRVAYGGSAVIVLNYVSSSVSVVDLRTGQVTTTSSSVGGSPMGLARVQ